MMFILVEVTTLFCGIMLHIYNSQNEDCAFSKLHYKGMLYKIWILEGITIACNRMN